MGLDHSGYQVTPVIVATAPDRRNTQSQSIRQRSPIAAVCHNDCVGAAMVGGEPAVPIGSGTLSMCTVGFSSGEKSGGPSPDATPPPSTPIILSARKYRA